MDYNKSKINKIIREVDEIIKVSFFTILNYATAKQDYVIISKLGDLVKEQLLLIQQLNKNPRKLYCLLDVIAETLLLIVDYTEERGIVLPPNLSSLINEYCTIT